MKLVLVFVLQFFLADMVDDVADERARPGRRVEYLDVMVFQQLAEMCVEEVVRAFDHEADDLVGRIDDAKPVGGFRVVAFVECFIDCLQELLLLMVVGNGSARRVDRLVVMLDSPEGFLPHVGDEKLIDDSLKLLCHVVLAVEVRIVEDRVEDVGC